VKAVQYQYTLLGNYPHQQKVQTEYENIRDTVLGFKTAFERLAQLITRLDENTELSPLDLYSYLLLEEQTAAQKGGDLRGLVVDPVLSHPLQAAHSPEYRQQVLEIARRYESAQEVSSELLDTWTKDRSPILMDLIMRLQEESIAKRPKERQLIEKFCLALITKETLFFTDIRNKRGKIDYKKINDTYVGLIESQKSEIKNLELKLQSEKKDHNVDHMNLQREIKRRILFVKALRYSFMLYGWPRQNQKLTEMAADRFQKAVQELAT
jgi:hypothetical protein